MVLPRITPWSATASMVFSGAVFTVFGGDQLDHVTGVVVRRVLDPGRRPQRSLLVRTGRRQRVPALAGELLLVELVGQPGVGDRRLAAQRRRLRGAEGVQPLVDLGVHPGHEERRHRLDLRQVMAVGLGLLQPVEVGVDHRRVALEGEDQRDVDADPLGQRRR